MCHEVSFRGNKMQLMYRSSISSQGRKKLIIIDFQCSPLKVMAWSTSFSMKYGYSKPTSNIRIVVVICAAYYVSFSTHSSIQYKLGSVFNYSANTFHLPMVDNSDFDKCCFNKPSVLNCKSPKVFVGGPCRISIRHCHSLFIAWKLLQWE